jgi:hypothetical protein
MNGLRKLARLDSYAGVDAMERLWDEDRDNFRQETLDGLRAASPGYARKVLTTIQNASSSGAIPGEVKAFIKLRAGEERYEKAVRLARSICDPDEYHAVLTEEDEKDARTEQIPAFPSLNQIGRR